MGEAFQDDPTVIVAKMDATANDIKDGKKFPVRRTGFRARALGGARSSRCAGRGLGPGLWAGLLHFLVAVAQLRAQCCPGA